MRWFVGAAIGSGWALALVACSSDGPASSGSAASTTTTTTSTSSGGGSGATSTSSGGGGGGASASSTTTGTGGGATTSSSGGGMGGGGGSPATFTGACAKACATQSDCCGGLPGCPGAAYPGNVVCNAYGACEIGPCATNDDCVAFFGDPSAACYPIASKASCVYACAVDGDCPGTAVCGGVADDGSKYCKALPAPCADDAECGIYGGCDPVSGECRCDDVDPAHACGPALVCVPLNP